jgi:hypothetical protein
MRKALEQQGFWQPAPSTKQGEVAASRTFQGDATSTAMQSRDILDEGFEFYSIVGESRNLFKIVAATNPRA